MRSLLADEHPEPLRLYLVPTSANGEVWEHSAREGREGGAFAQGFAFVYVPRTSWESTLRLHFERATLRHELTHLSARRCGLARGKWFSEGLRARSRA